MKRTLLVLFLSCLFLVPGVLYAQAKDEPSLVNPGVSPEVWDSLMGNKGSEPTLQHLLDSLGYNINVVNDLLPTEVWVAITGQYKEVMLAEFAGWASQTSSGWYGHGNQSDRHQIFSGANHPGDSVSFTITGCDSNGLYIKVPKDDKYTDYDYYYTEKSLNSDNKDHAKVYCSKKRPNEFIVAWEDTKNLGDADFNDLVLAYRMPNRAPVLEVPHDTSFFQCEPETIRFDNIRAHDSDYCGDTVVINKVQGPGTYDAGTCRFLPAAVDSVYRFVFVATDWFGAADTDTVVITVDINDPPQLTCPDNDSVHAGDTLISTDFSVTDPEGKPTPVVFLDINPGVTNTPTIVNNHVKWVTTCGEDGDYVIRLVATDDCGAKDTCEFTVNVYNQPPQLTCPDDDSVYAGDTLISTDFSVTDPDGDTASVTFLDINPTATNTPSVVANHVKWVTTSGEHGDYVIRLVATDDCRASDTCEFTVSIYNQAPVLTCPDNDSVHAGDTLISTDFTSTDPDGDTAIVTFLDINPTAINTPTIVANHVEWITTCDEDEDYVIRLVATDPRGLADTCQFTVNVYHHLPQLTCPNDTSVSAGDTLISGDFTVTDPEGDLWGLEIINMYPLPEDNWPTIVDNHVEWLTTCNDTLGSYTIVLGAADSCYGIDSCQFTVNVYPHPPQLTCPNDTSVSVGDTLISGDFTVTDPGSDSRMIGVWVYPFPGFNLPTIVDNHVEWIPRCGGTYTIVLEVIDSCLDWDTCQFTVTVNDYDHTPQLTCPNDTIVSIGDTLISGDLTVTDPRGDLWMLRIIDMYPHPAGPPYNEPTIVDNHVEWLTTGFDTLGSYTIVLEAVDSCFNVDSCQFTVNVYFQAPVITSTPDTTAFVGVPYTYGVDATGIPAPIFALNKFPTGMTINPNSGVIHWTPAAVGDFDVSVEASNLAGADTQSFTISVAESAQVSILPDTLLIQCDHEDTLWIYLDEKVVDMYSAFFKIAYEDTLITPDTVIKGPALVPPGNFDLSYGIHPDSILISLVVLSGSFDGPDTILGIVFTASDYVTTAQVNIERSSLYNSEAEEIPHRTIGAEIQIDCPTSVDGEDQETSQIPSVYGLNQNYPNPYNPATQIAYQLPQAGMVSLKIYNIKGELVRTLVNEYKPAGNHTAVWDGRDDKGKEVSSGVYLYRIQAGKFKDSRKMILIK